MPTNIVKLTTKPSEPMTRETVLIIGHIGEEANLKEDDPGVILDKLSRSGKRDTYLKNAIDQTCDQCLARGMPGVFNELFKRSLDAVEEQGSEAFKLYKQHQLPEHAMDKILNQQHITIKRLQDIHDLSHRVETKRQWSRLIRSIYVVMVQFINMVTVTVVRSNK